MTRETQQWGYWLGKLINVPSSLTKEWRHHTRKSWNTKSQTTSGLADEENLFDLAYPSRVSCKNLKRQKTGQKRWQTDHCWSQEWFSKTVKYGGFIWKRTLRLAMRRAKTQKMVFYEGGNEQGNSSSRKSKESGGTIVIVDDACAGYFLIRRFFLGI